MATDYAIVATGGKQYRVEKGDSFVVDRLAEDEGAKVSLRAVMFRGESDVVLVPSELEKVKVEAKVAAHERGPKIKVATYKAKKGYRRTKGHRSELTRLEVTDVKLLSRRPAKPEPKAADGEAPAAAAAADAPTKAKPKAAGDATTKAKPEAGDTTSKAKPKRRLNRKRKPSEAMNPFPRCDSSGPLVVLDRKPRLSICARQRRDPLHHGGWKPKLRPAFVCA